MANNAIQPLIVHREAKPYEFLGDNRGGAAISRGGVLYEASEERVQDGVTLFRDQRIKATRLSQNRRNNFRKGYLERKKRAHPKIIWWRGDHVSEVVQHVGKAVDGRWSPTVALKSKVISRT